MEKNKEKEFENFRKEIFGLRKANKWTQKQVADQLGISQSYISRLEKRILSRLKKEMAQIL